MKLQQNAELSIPPQSIVTDWFTFENKRQRADEHVKTHLAHNFVEDKARRWLQIW